MTKKKTSKKTLLTPNNEKMQQRLAEATALAKEHGGYLPGCGWLIDHGYRPLYTYVTHHREYFKHLIKPNNRAASVAYKRLPENLALAQQLAAANNGILPNPEALISAGHRSLYHSMLRYPEVYSDIPVSRNGNLLRNERTLAVQVALAEKLATENDGRIPSLRWLTRNGHSSLAASISKHSDAYKHLQRETVATLSDKYWKSQVALAERLTRENNEKLPAATWLIRNNYWGLYGAIRRRPHLFAHLTMERLDNRCVGVRESTIARHLATARKLISENDGKVPGCAWLMRKGYTSLYIFMLQNPEMFKDIPRAPHRRGRPPKVKTERV